MGQAASSGLESLPSPSPSPPPCLLPYSKAGEGNNTLHEAHPSLLPSTPGSKREHPPASPWMTGLRKLAPSLLLPCSPARVTNNMRAVTEAIRAKQQRTDPRVEGQPATHKTSQGRTAGAHGVSPKPRIQRPPPRTGLSLWQSLPSLQMKNARSQNSRAPHRGPRPAPYHPFPALHPFPRWVI